MKKLIALLLLGMLVSCASKKPRLSQEELRRIRTQPVVVDISNSQEANANKELPSHNGTIHISKYSQTAEEKRQAKSRIPGNADILVWGILEAIPIPAP